MRRDAQETMQQKIDGLDTLSAGIVYGREAAWDKLQDRMEQKPVKKIAVGYWVAAAILLLFACVSVLYLQPVQDVVVKTNIAVPADNNALQNTPATLASQPTALQVRALPTITYHEKQKRPVVVSYMPAIPTIVIAEPGPTPVGPPVVAPVPAAPVAKMMKTYHINDLQHPTSNETSVTSIVPTDPVDIRNLPVVHISEVAQQEHEVRRIMKENREAFIQFPLPRRISADEAAADTYTPPDNLLRLKLHPQN